MRLDTHSVDPIIEAAGLSEREQQVFRLQCLDLNYRQIAHELKIAPGTASCMLTRITAKIDQAWAEAEAALKAKAEEQWSDESQEEQEAASVSSRRGELTFVFQSLRGPRRSDPSPPLVGKVFSGYVEGQEVHFAELVRVNAGCPVTVDDFLAEPVESAWDKRVTAPFRKEQ